MDEPDFALKRIAGQVMNSALEREKRHLGMGFVGRLLKRSFKSERYQKDDVQKQMDSLDDHRYI